MCSVNLLTKLSSCLERWDRDSYFKLTDPKNLALDPWDLFQFGNITQIFVLNIELTWVSPRRQRAANQYWTRGDLEEAFGLFTKTQTPPAEIYCLYDTLFSDTTAGVSVAGLPEDKTRDYHVFLLQYVSKTGKIHPNFFFFI